MSALGELGKSQRGVALVLVLWVVVLLSVIATAFTQSQRNEMGLTRNVMELAQARAFAESGVQRGIFELAQPNNDPNRWKSDGTPLIWEVDGAQVSVIARSETARIDLNSGSPLLLKGIFKVAAGLDEEAATQIVEQIADWRDADDLKRPNGAEADDYRAAGRKVLPSNTDFAAVSELQNVLDVTPEIYASVAPFLTVHSRQRGVFFTNASRQVLLAIPNMTPEIVDVFLELRAAALASGQPVPALPGATGEVYSGGSPSVIRFRSEVKLAHGMKHFREAVVHMPPVSNPKQPPGFLTWQDYTGMGPEADAYLAPTASAQPILSSNGQPAR